MSSQQNVSISTEQGSAICWLRPQRLSLLRWEWKVLLMRVLMAHYLAARKHKKTVDFVISFTGANRTAETMARYLREATNNHIVGILGPYNEKIRQWCHETVEIPNRDSILSLDVITSFAAANYVLDIFFSMLLARRQEEHIKSSVEMLKHRELLVNRPELLQ